MAYFDDPAHRAAWEKELDEILKEKENRKAGILPSEQGLALGQNSLNPEKARGLPATQMYSGRIRISYEQLAEKAYGKPQKTPQLSRSFSRQVEHTMTKQAGGKSQ